MPLVSEATTVYQCIVPTHSALRLPQMCCCCLRPTNNFQRIEYLSVKRGLVTRSKSHTALSLPLCPLCQAHQREVSIKAKLALLASIICSFGLFVALRSYGAELFLAMTVFIIAALTIFMLTNRWLPLTKLGADHILRGPCVALSKVDDKLGITIINFASQNYAQAFSRLNNISYEPAQAPGELGGYLLRLIIICLLLGFFLQNLTV